MEVLLGQGASGLKHRSALQRGRRHEGGRSQFDPRAGSGVTVHVRTNMSVKY